jgi:HK97 family phage major capsid protein
MPTIEELVSLAESAAAGRNVGDIGSVKARLQAERTARHRELRSILTTAEAEKRDLRAGEQREFDRLKADIDALDDAVLQVEEQEQRSGAAASATARIDGGSMVRVLSEGRTYNRDAERLHGVSFLRDVADAQLRHDPGALERLQRHQAEARDVYGTEYRDVGTGAYSGLIVPQYLTDLAAPLRRAGRPTADICNIHPLPPGGMTVNISRITTGASAAAQATENTGVSETDMDDTLLAVNVRTIAGMQDVSRQAVERGTGVDAIVIGDLARAYNTELDRQIINSDGTSGTHLGIRSTPSIVAVAYTDATPTGPELYPKLFDLVQQIQSGTFLGVSHLVMHPRRWWWLASQVGTSFPFLQLAGAPQGAAGAVLGTGSYEEGLAGVLSTVGVVVDGSIPTNLGGGTNEDVILGVTSSELHLWEDPRAPLLIRAEQALANQLSVRFVLYGYTAFTAGRYPGAHGTISGTGLAAPTF